MTVMTEAQFEVQTLHATDGHLRWTPLATHDDRTLAEELAEMIAPDGRPCRVVPVLPQHDPLIGQYLDILRSTPDPTKYAHLDLTAPSDRRLISSVHRLKVLAGEIA